MSLYEKLAAVDINDVWAGDVTAGLLNAKARAKALLGEFPELQEAIESSITAYLEAAPTLDDLEYEMAGAEKWAAAGIAALLRLTPDNADHTERSATQALAHASRILMHQTGQRAGFKAGGMARQIEQQQKLEENRQLAEEGKAAKSARMRRLVQQRYLAIIKETPDIAQGEAKRLIAEDLGRSLATVDNYCRELGLLKRNRKNLIS